MSLMNRTRLRLGDYHDLFASSKRGSVVLISGQLRHLRVSPKETMNICVKPNNGMYLPALRAAGDAGADM